MKIVVVDDYAVVRRGLQQIIERQPGWNVVAEVETADDVLPLLRRTPADILLLDVTLGGRSGIDLLGHLRREFPSLPVLILSMHSEEHFAIRCLRAGASGYIQKESSAAEIVEAIRRVAAGRTYVSAAMTEQLAMEVARGPSKLPHEGLSTREFEVFRLLAGGNAVGEIAELLHLSVKTVSTHRTRILEKTGFHSNADLTAYAIRNGLI